MTTHKESYSGLRCVQGLGIEGMPRRQEPRNPPEPPQPQTRTPETPGTPGTERRFGAGAWEPLDSGCATREPLILVLRSEFLWLSQKSKKRRQRRRRATNSGTRRSVPGSRRTPLCSTGRPSAHQSSSTTLGSRFGVAIFLFFGGEGLAPHPARRLHELHA